MGRAEREDVMRFIRAVCPEAPDLYLASFSEKQALNDAADRILNLEAALLRIAKHCGEVRGGAPPHVWIPSFVRQHVKQPRLETAVGCTCPQPLLHADGKDWHKSGCPSLNRRVE
jgi:hypothetical protein